MRIHLFSFLSLRMRRVNTISGYFLFGIFFAKYRIVQVQHFPYSLNLTSFFFLFPKLKFITIQRRRFPPCQKKSFRSSSSNRKLSGICVLNAKGTILKKKTTKNNNKWTFHSLFTSVFINTASVSILFQHNSLNLFLLLFSLRSHEKYKFYFDDTFS